MVQGNSGKRSSSGSNSSSNRNENVTNFAVVKTSVADRRLICTSREEELDPALCERVAPPCGQLNLSIPCLQHR